MPARIKCACSRAPARIRGRPFYKAGLYVIRISKKTCYVKALLSCPQAKNLSDHNQNRSRPESSTQASCSL